MTENEIKTSPNNEPPEVPNRPILVEEYDERHAAYQPSLNDIYIAVAGLSRNIRVRLDGIEALIDRNYATTLENIRSLEKRLETVESVTFRLEKEVARLKDDRAAPVQ